MIERKLNMTVPKGLEKFILKNADKFYLFYNNKYKTAYCTCCNKEIKYQNKYKHGLKAKCPNCKKEVITHSEGRGRKVLTEEGRILWMQKHGNETWIELDQYIIDYTKNQPNVKIAYTTQYSLSHKKSSRYSLYYKYYEGFHWKESYQIYLPSLNNMYYRYTDKILIYNYSFGSDLKYINQNKVEGLNPYTLIKYLGKFVRYQAVELLEKGGFEELIDEYVSLNGTNSLNIRGKNIESILRLSKGEVRALRERGGISMRDLDIYTKVKKIDNTLTLDEVEALHLVTYNLENEIKKVKKYTSLKKAASYLVDQNSSLRILLDYYSECEKLGEDLTRKKILFPKNLQEAHEETSNRIEIENDRKIEENFIKKSKELYPYEPFIKDGLLIRLATKPAELRKESRGLCHCVRTYTEKVAKGRCAILLIRKVGEEDKPYFTLELSPDNEIVQCRGHKNCSYPEEVEKFLKAWKNEILNKKRSAA